MSSDHKSFRVTKSSRFRGSNFLGSQLKLVLVKFFPRRMVLVIRLRRCHHMVCSQSEMMQEMQEMHIENNFTQFICTESVSTTNIILEQ
jgi:hypothetical protein